jgi:glycosyltransferase involved in cell wall biosynthesis
MAATLALHRGTWSTVDRMVVLTPVMADYARGLGIADERIVVRPNPVPDPGPPTPVGDGFLFAGRLSAEKGLMLLLEAWSRHPDGALGRLRIAGDGPLADAVRARTAGRADIEYLGQLAPADLATMIRRSAVVVVPSTWDEVCPTVALAALAQGRPVLGSARGGLPWIIGDAGWVVDPTVPSLATALPEARARAADLGAPARQRYEEQFTPERAMRTLLDAYRDARVSPARSS